MERTELSRLTIYGSEGEKMREEYDFAGARRNPYAARIKKQITINLDESNVEYFKKLAEETGIPYQTLINPYLADCVKNQRKPDLSWRSA